MLLSNVRSLSWQHADVIPLEVLECWLVIVLQGRGGEDSSSVCIYVKSMHEVPRLIPTTSETSRVFKIGIERELVISVEARIFY